MTPRTWSYGDVEGEDLPIRDRPYESYGRQGFAMPDHPPQSSEPRDPADHVVDGWRRGDDRLELGERIGGQPSGPKNWERSDERVHDDVCRRLSDDPLVDPSEVEVVVHHGEVTLSGIVHEGRQRERAVRLAESVRGVVDVVSRLRVAPEPPDARRR